MTRIIISIVSLLLVLFPFSSTLLATHQQLTFAGTQVISDNIIDAIKSNDIQAIKDMLSEERKQNMADPEKSISEFIKYIDGEIVEVSKHHLGGESSESGAGYVYKVNTWTLEIETNQNTYWLHITWVVSDTKNPETVGMSSMTLLDTEYNILANLYY
jgi:hypothetical protein